MLRSFEVALRHEKNYAGRTRRDFQYRLRNQISRLLPIVNATADRARQNGLLHDHDVAALDWTRQIGPLDRDVAEVHGNPRAHQWIRTVGHVKMQMWLG